ncbi:MAG: DUF2063 domain-containing protein [Methyloversatilis sp.]|nr:DUF2063 domain-containing protein [Methyloversatilis sp.]
MSALLEAQRRFGAALAGAAGEADALPLLAGDPVRNRALLSVYRATAVANAVAALRLALPVCVQITGDDFFDALARAYRDTHPSSDGDLNRYGAGFAAFLDGFGPVSALPYLPGVARLEWAVHQASTAADAEPAGGRLFAGLDADALARSRLRFVPGFALLASAWPVADIWLAHADDAEALTRIDLTSAQCAVVWREGWRVRVAALAPAACALWQALRRRETVGAAWAAACAVDPAFDLGPAFAQALSAGWLHAIDLKEDVS